MKSEVTKFYVDAIKEASAHEEGFQHKTEELLDKIIVWIAGIEVATIGFLVSTDKLGPQYTKPVLTWIVAILSCSLLLGTVSRLLKALSNYYRVIVTGGAKFKLISVSYPTSLEDMSPDEAKIHVDALNKILDIARESNGLTKEQFDKAFPDGVLFNQARKGRILSEWALFLYWVFIILFVTGVLIFAGVFVLS